MILETIVEPFLEWVLGSQAQTTVILILAIVIVYFRKALGLGSLLADWVGRAIFTAGVLLVLLITGIVPGINVDRFIALVQTSYSLAVDAIQGIL